MGTRAKSQSNNGGIMDRFRPSKAVRGASRCARSIQVADSIATSRDFACFMSMLIGDIVSGRIDPKTANAACNAGGKLLRIVELEHKFGRGRPEAKEDRAFSRLHRSRQTDTKLSRDDAHRIVFRLRWPEGHPVCPKCLSVKMTQYERRRQWRCRECGYLFSITSGTIMDGSHLNPEKWLAAIRAMSLGVSDRRISMDIGMNWRTSRRIRMLILSGDEFGKRMLDYVNGDPNQ